jgi:hypothetical protein
VLFWDLVKIALFLILALFAAGPSWAIEKGGMPDLAQIDNTCLPTSAANLMIWFGKHGYPKLIQPGATGDESADHVVHRLMADTGARYDIGTEMDAVTRGLEAYIHRSGYACDVEYRGLDGKSAFSQDWLQQNDDPNKGFVLLLTYCRYNPQNNSFSEAWNAGHAVTLVNAEPDLLLIHDPAHDETETGRKIITPRLLTSGMFEDAGAPMPVAGLLMLSGSLLEAPPDSQVMLTGAVCITLHQNGSASPAPMSGPNTMLAGPAGNGTAPTSSAASSAKAGWWSWVLSLVLGK